MMANIWVIVFVIALVTCVIGLVLFGTYFLNKSLDRSAR
jgi:hypothetical protein